MNESYYSATKSQLKNAVYGGILCIFGLILILCGIYLALEYPRLLLRRRGTGSIVFALCAAGSSAISFGYKNIIFVLRSIGEQNESRRMFRGTLTYIGKNKRKHYFANKIDIKSIEGFEISVFLNEKCDIPYGSKIYVMYGQRTMLVYKLVVEEYGEDMI